MTIYALLGASDTGKDSVFKIIHRVKQPTLQVSFFAPGKRFLEEMYGLPRFKLEDKDFRNEIVHGSSGKTYRQVMLDWYECRNRIDPDLYVTRAYNHYIDHLNAGANLVFTDIRHRNEADMVNNLVLLNLSVNLHLIYIRRNNASVLSSDTGLSDNMRLLSTWATKISFISNNGTMEELETEVLKII